MEAEGAEAGGTFAGAEDLDDQLVTVDERSDAFGGAGGEDVAGLQGHDPAHGGDEGRDAPDHVGGGSVLANRAVDEGVSRVEAADEAAAESVAEDMEAVRAADEKAADARTAASVTPAEIRVLRYLPTTLSFALIADKLGISRGAAKSRAERAYKKLDVHNRADAVDRARALRVLP